MLDMGVLVGGIGVAFAMSWPRGVVMGFVLGHFFLFCNIVRLARSPELAWSVVFVTLAAATIATDVPGWLATVSVSLIATVAVVVAEMRKPLYHGVGWQWINPGLKARWESRMGE